MNILIINGPNLNLLGSRETEIYGDISLKQLEKKCSDQFESLHDILWKQSNHEGVIIDWIHQAIEQKVDALVINPAAYSHYSIAILDALRSFQGAKVEIHISDISKREKFRRTSLTSLACDHMICGMGADGYIMAIKYLINQQQE